MGLILFETLLLSLSAVVMAAVIKVAMEFILGPWVQSQYGLYLQSPIFSFNEIVYMLIMLISSLVISLIPARRAMRSALKDGLNIRI